MSLFVLTQGFVGPLIIGAFTPDEAMALVDHALDRIFRKPCTTADHCPRQAGCRVMAAGDALLALSVTRRLIEEFARHPACRTVHADARRRAADEDQTNLIGHAFASNRPAAWIAISLSCRFHC